MLKFLYRVFEKIGNLYVWCIGVTTVGIGACILYGILLDDYLKWKSSQSRLEREQVELTQQYEQKSKELSVLKLELVTFEKKKAQLLSVEKRLLELQTVIEEKQKNDSRLDGAIAQKNQALQDKTNELESVSGRVNSTAAELGALSTNLVQTKEEYEKIKAENAALSETSQKKEQEIQRINRDIEELEKAKGNLQNQNNDLQQNLSSIQGRLSAGQEEEKQLAERIKTLRTERDTVQRQLSETQNKIDELSGSRANARRLEMERNITKLQESVQVAEAALKQKANELKNASDELVDTVRRRDVLKSECDGLETLKAEKQNSLDTLKKEYDTKHQQNLEIEAEINKKNSLLQSVSHSVEELQKKKSALQTECVEIEKVLREKQEKLEKLKEEEKIKTK